MSEILCTAITRWIHEHDYPTVHVETITCLPETIWCLSLAKDPYILVKSTKKVVARLEPSDPAFFRQLKKALDSIPRSCYSKADEP